MFLFFYSEKKWNVDLIKSQINDSHQCNIKQIYIYIKKTIKFKTSDAYFFVPLIPIYPLMFLSIALVCLSRYMGRTVLIPWCPSTHGRQSRPRSQHNATHRRRGAGLTHTGLGRGTAQLAQDTTVRCMQHTHTLTHMNTHTCIHTCTHVHSHTRLLIKWLWCYRVLYIFHSLLAIE